MPTTQEIGLPQKEPVAVDEFHLYQIILFDDDEHSYQYVIEMLTNLFELSQQDAFEIAYEVDNCGQAVVKTCPLGEAIEGRDMILNYGPDPRLKISNSSMRAIVQEKID